MWSRLGLSTASQRGGGGGGRAVIGPLSRRTVLALHGLELEPIIDLRTRLGQGTGAVVAPPIVRAAAAALASMAMFDEAGITACILLLVAGALRLRHDSPAAHLRRHRPMRDDVLSAAGRGVGRVGRRRALGCVVRRSALQPAGGARAVDVLLDRDGPGTRTPTGLSEHWPTGGAAWDARSAISGERDCPAALFGVAALVVVILAEPLGVR